MSRSGVHLENTRSVYFSNRDRFNKLVARDGSETEEAAVLFYYLNRTAFNGLCRFNRQGAFNVPFGRYKTITYQMDFTDYEIALAHYSFEVGDFSAIESHSGDLIYADPPNDVEFTSYSADRFNWPEQSHARTS